MTIPVFGLIHFELEAMDSNSVGSSLASTATELSGNPQKKNPLIGPGNGFARGTRKWQTYASGTYTFTLEVASDFANAVRYESVTLAPVSQDR